MTALSGKLAEMGELVEAEIASLRGAGRTLGGAYFDAWEAVARALGRDPGIQPGEGSDTAASLPADLEVD